MGWRLQRMRRRALQRDVARKATAIVMVAFFSFQFIRFYLVAPLDAFECFEPNFRHGISASENHGHHHDELGIVPHSNDDESYTLQHCKDTYNGIGLTPVQPLGLPIAVSPEFRGLALTLAVYEPSQPLENILLPPFQPPRHLS